MPEARPRRWPEARGRARARRRAARAEGAEREDRELRRQSAAHDSAGAQYASPHSGDDAAQSLGHERSFSAPSHVPLPQRAHAAAQSSSAQPTRPSLSTSTPAPQTSSSGPLYAPSHVELSAALPPYSTICSRARRFAAWARSRSWKLAGMFDARVSEEPRRVCRLDRCRVADHASVCRFRVGWCRSLDCGRPAPITSPRFRASTSWSKAC